MKSVKDIRGQLSDCLYFSTNVFSRSMTRMAEDAFAPTGLSPSHAFTLKLVIENPGIVPNDLAKILQLAPSTVTRLVDLLVAKKYVRRESEGKISRLTATAKGEKVRDSISKAWRSLQRRYDELLGKEAGEQLTRLLIHAADKLVV